MVKKMSRNLIKEVNNKVDQNLPLNSQHENKLVITTKKPTKELKAVCKQLRTILKPKCFTKLKSEYANLRQCKKDIKNYLISHLVLCKRKEIEIGSYSMDKTFYFDIAGYTNNFKTFKDEVYQDLPFITLFGFHNCSKEISKVMKLFKSLGTTDKLSKRVINVTLEKDLIYIRHYIHYVKNTEDNYRVGLKEIGPRFTLKYKSFKEGFFK